VRHRALGFVEGWHGVPFGKPHARTREYTAIIGKVVAHEAPLEHQAEQAGGWLRSLDVPNAPPLATRG
jgi:hypothetical protein